MFNIVLYEPEIPPNTGNVIRLCANTGAKLHLIKPLGFEIDDAKLKRAGLDYHEWANVQVHDNVDNCLKFIQFQNNFVRVYAFTSKGDVQYNLPKYQPGDIFLFGPETRGLPKEVLSGEFVSAKVFLPQVTAGRSLNLSNTVAIALYEALRQNNYQFD